MYSQDASILNGINTTANYSTGVNSSIYRNDSIISSRKKKQNSLHLDIPPILNRHQSTTILPQVKN
jgi:hypothetical protein